MAQLSYRRHRFPAEIIQHASIGWASMRIPAMPARMQQPLGLLGG
jgi:hypothetical protein